MVASLLLGRIRGSGRLALTAAEFAHFLGVLDADRTAAGERYEMLRRKLLLVFAARRSGGDTSQLVDETLDRVARRLHEGIPLETALESYVLGVARNVLREHWKKAPREVEILPHTYRGAREPSPAGDQTAADCLEKCLSELQPRPRGWILRFYSAGSGSGGGARIAGRKRLATELGLDLNALRVRMCRIRAKLEDCLKSCMDGGNDSGKGAIS